MLTKKDIELLLEHFVTRTEFDQAIERLEEKMATKTDIDRVMTTLDIVLGEVKAMRMEQAANSQRFDDTDKEIDGLKKRVKKIEDHHPTQQL